ncbi:zinc finger domain-containing protein [Mycolicibacterium moriokaense]|uniref:zinc finger domain-containing protein n=1 Tax=Mycolicibacterium moriokaense TaxID=39691 RepID=UPI003B3A636B
MKTLVCTISCPFCGASPGQPCVELRAGAVGRMDTYHFTRVGWPRGGPEYGPNTN